MSHHGCDQDERNAELRKQAAAERKKRVYEIVAGAECNGYTIRVWKDAPKAPDEASIRELRQNVQIELSRIFWQSGSAENLYAKAGSIAEMLMTNLDLSACEVRLSSYHGAGVCIYREWP